MKQSMTVMTFKLLCLQAKSKMRGTIELSVWLMFSWNLQQISIASYYVCPGSAYWLWNCLSFLSFVHFAHLTWKPGFPSTFSLFFKLSWPTANSPYFGPISFSYLCHSFFTTLCKVMLQSFITAGRTI